MVRITKSGNICVEDFCDKNFYHRSDVLSQMKFDGHKGNEINLSDKWNNVFPTVANYIDAQADRAFLCFRTVKI